jgi:predicted RNase H-like HicB family nuclease
MPPTAVLISSAEGSFVVYDPETGTATQGDSVPEAISNLREATESYLEAFPLEQTSQALLTTLEVAAHA